MDRVAQIGAACTVAGLLSYIVAVIHPYPGRELSLVAILIGVTCYAIGGTLP